MSSEAIQRGTVSTRFVNEKLWWPVEYAEALNRFLKRSVGVSLTKLNRKTLYELANVSPVHEVFGSQDPFRQLLETLLDGVDANKNLSGFAYLSLSDFAVSCLRARKECMDYVFAHPEVLQQKFEKPIVITGMHRTGSTLLYNLMHLDERTRSPFMYEMYGNWPHLPAVTRRAAHYTDPRMAALQKLLGQAEKIMPEGTEKRNKAHPTTHDMIEEESVISSHQMNWHMHTTLFGKAYKDALFEPDKGFIFKYMKIYFQMLQTGYAPASHWTLKSPAHLLHIDSFMDTFADARVVVLHRDPKSTIPSVSYLAEGLYGCCWQPNSWQRSVIGEFAVELYKTMTQRLMRYRDVHPEKEDQFLDIKFSDLEADPIGTVQLIYRKFGIEYDESLTAKMQAHLLGHKKHKHGKPNYSLDLYGVSPALIDREFAEYNARYLGSGGPSRDRTTKEG